MLKLLIEHERKQRLSQSKSSISGESNQPNRLDHETKQQSDSMATQKQNNPNISRTPEAVYAGQHSAMSPRPLRFLRTSPQSDLISAYLSSPPLLPLSPNGSYRGEEGDNSGEKDNHSGQ